MEPLFKVGDVVRIKEGLNEYTKVPFGVNSDMQELAGKKAQITAVEANQYKSGAFPTVDGCDECQYRIDKDSGKWSWSSPMFERVTSEIGSKLKLAKRHNIRLNFKN